MAELERRGYPCGWAPTDDPRAAVVELRADAVILPRLAWPAADHPRLLRRRDALRARGGALIYEVDDDIFSGAITARILETGSDGRTPAELEAQRRDRIAALRLADGVTVSTQRLATVVRRFTDAPVHVVPNAIDLRWWARVLRSAPPARRHAGVTIGWAGGRRPDRDAEAMAVAWGRVARRHPEARFRVAGWPLASIVAAVQADRLTVEPWRPLEAYPLAYAGLDIGCCPLDGDPFSRSKSPIKLWEYTAAGAAVVASPTVYGSYIEHGEDGLIAETADAWEEAIERLIAAPDLRRHLYRNQRRRMAEHHALETQALRWPEAWAAIVRHARKERAA